jgi:protein phosphatase
MVQMMVSKLKGPYDIIGDVHGCYDELVLLLEKLGYHIDGDKVTSTNKRKVIFVGDLVDRGPKIVEVLKLTMKMVDDGMALSVAGNHDDKLLRYLSGRNVKIQHGLEQSVEALKHVDQRLIKQVKHFLSTLPTHVILDDGNLVIAHAGIKEKYIGQDHKRIKSFTLFGDTTGEVDEFGLPVRLIWAKDYHGQAKIIYGHTPNLEVFEMNNTFNIDTGCVFGNKLTAYRYPENELVSVKALKEYSKSKRPLE